MNNDILGQSEESEAPEKQYDENNHLIVKINNKVATISNLTGYQSIRADRMIGNGNQTVMLKVYGLFALRSLKINGDVIPLPSLQDEIQASRRADLFTVSELVALGQSFMEEYGQPPASGDELKNS